MKEIMSKFITIDGLQSGLEITKTYIDDSIPTKVSELEGDELISNDKEFNIVDNNGRVAVSINKDGLHTAKLTVNGESLDTYIEGQIYKLAFDITGSSSGTSIVYHDSSEDTLELTPNVIHKWDVANSLTLSIPEETDYHVNHYKAVFSVTSSDFTLSLPSNLRWINDEVPTFSGGMQYEISIEDGRILWSKFKANSLEGGMYLEYIENDGTDYIMTDILMSNSMYGFQCKSAPLFSDTGTYAIAGTRSVSGVISSTSCFIWYISGNRATYWNGIETYFGSFTNGTIYEDSITATKNNVSSSYPLIVFGANNAGTPQYNNKFRLYALDFLGFNGEPLISLRPYQNFSDGSIGLKDTVSGKFYPSVNGNLIGK